MDDLAKLKQWKYTALTSFDRVRIRAGIYDVPRTATHFASVLELILNENEQLRKRIKEQASLIEQAKEGECNTTNNSKSRDQKNKLRNTSEKVE